MSGFAASSSLDLQQQPPPDPKLLHIVRKQLAQITSSANTTDEEELQSNAMLNVVVNRIRTQHREYQRKEEATLKASVQVAIRHISEESHKKKKQKKRRQEEKDEEEYERAAILHETAISGGGGGGGGLNASLRSNYQRKQQQQQQAVVSSSESSLPSAVVSATISNSTQETPTKEEATPTKSAKNSGKNTPGSAQQLPPLSSKRKKLKRSSSSSVRRGSSNQAASDETTSRSTGLQVSFLVPQRPTERYTDLGGLTDTIQTIRQLVEYPLTRPELYRHLGVDPPRGVLLRGPPGTGKTHLANAVAGQLGVPFFRASAPELVSGMSGESESRIRDLFQAASDAAPALIFLDEIDAIAPKRSDASNARGMEKRIVAQLLTSMDALAPRNNRNGHAVLVLAATNRPDSLDAALRRAGRFDKEILLGVPDEAAREKILQTMTAGMRLMGNSSSDNNTSSGEQRQFNYKELARKTPGFVGADVKSLAKEAAVIAINRIFRDVLKDESTHNDPLPEDEQQKTTTDTGEPDTVAPTSTITPLSAEQMEPLYVTMEDFLAALPLVQPSSKREGFATVPDVTWNDIGALHSIREELAISVLEPIRAPEKFQALGLPLPAGVMLFGPPGCGKTLLAKAVANESGANFISVKGPELLDKYVGESEKAVRLVFERARSSSPCIVFFDELDSLVPRRGSDSGGGGVSERVVNQLLTEMDGLESRRSVFVIAATNRPELIDPAMMRPGRLDKLLYVQLPTAEERVSILRALATNVKLGDDVDLGAIGRSVRAEGYSGADCAALLRESGLAVMKEDAAALASGKPDGSVALCVRAKHFDAAFPLVMPSVSKRDQARYDRIRDRMASARSRGTRDVGADAVDESTLVPKAVVGADKKSIAGAGSADGNVIPLQPDKKNENAAIIA